MNTAAGSARSDRNPPPRQIWEHITCVLSMCNRARKHVKQVPLKYETFSAIFGVTGVEQRLILKAVQREPSVRDCSALVSRSGRLLACSWPVSCTNCTVESFHGRRGTDYPLLRHQVGWRNCFSGAQSATIGQWVVSACPAGPTSLTGTSGAPTPGAPFVQYCRARSCYRGRGGRDSNRSLLIASHIIGH